MLMFQCCVTDRAAEVGEDVIGSEPARGVFDEPTFFGESTASAHGHAQAVGIHLKVLDPLDVDVPIDEWNTDCHLGAEDDELVATSADALEDGLHDGAHVVASDCEPFPLQKAPSPVREVSVPWHPEGVAPTEPTCYPADIKHFKAVLKKKPERGARFTRLGLQLTKRDMGLAIVAFAGSGDLAMEWNRKHPKQRLQMGDIITAVNGVAAAAGADALLKEVNTAGQLILSVSRVLAYSFSFPKAPCIGLDVSMVDGSVVGIHDGIVQKFNSKPSSQWMIAHGDVLVEVGGVRGTPEAMIHALKQDSGLLTLKFKRWLS